jgi:hypothetical protein
MDVKLVSSGVYLSVVLKLIGMDGYSMVLVVKEFNTILFYALEINVLFTTS